MRPQGDPVEKDVRALSGSGPTIEAGPTTPAGPTTQAGPLGIVVRPPPGKATMMVVVGFVALLASLVVLGAIAEAIRAQEVFALDGWATPFLHGIASPGLDRLMQTFTDIGSNLVIIPIFVAVCAWLIWKHRYGAALFLGVASGGALILDGTMKLFFHRPRPQLDWAKVLPDYSFPSGHTMNAFVFYVALALILWSVFGRRVGLVATGIAALIAFGVGVSRIYLGYHYLTDVVGGLLAGIAWLMVVGAAFRARPTWWRWGARDTAGSHDRSGPGTAAVR